MRRVVRSDQSAADLTQIWCYVARDDVSAADRLMDRIDVVLHRLAECLVSNGSDLLAQVAAAAAAAAAGDADALQRLIVRYHSILHGRVAARIGRALRRRIDADDVLQQAYVSAFRQVGQASFDGAGGFYKWLETIALHELADQQRALRRQKRDIAREIQALRAAATATHPFLLDRLTSPDGTPSRPLRQAEAAAAVLTCIARLSEERRTLVRMRFLEERPVAEVAAALGRSEAAVHMLTHRTLKELRGWMGALTGFLSRL